MADDKSVSSRKYRADIERSRREGFEEGINAGRREILDWLERTYLTDPGRPDRGSPKAEAMLTLAQEASDHFRKKTGGRMKSRGN